MPSLKCIYSPLNERKEDENYSGTKASRVYHARNETARKAVPLSTVRYYVLNIDRASVTFYIPLQVLNSTSNSTSLYATEQWTSCWLNALGPSAAIPEKESPVCAINESRTTTFQ